MRFVNLRGRRLTKRCSHTRSAWGGEGREGREGRVERMSQGMFSPRIFGMSFLCSRQH